MKHAPIPEAILIGGAAFAAWLEGNAHALPIPPWAALLATGIAGAVGMAIRHRMQQPGGKG